MAQQMSPEEQRAAINAVVSLASQHKDWPALEQQIVADDGLTQVTLNRAQQLAQEVKEGKNLAVTRTAPARESAPTSPPADQPAPAPAATAAPPPAERKRLGPDFGTMLAGARGQLAQPTGVFGLPVWVLLGAFLVLVLAVRSGNFGSGITATIGQPQQPGMVAPIVIQPDTSGLLTVRGVPVPIKRVSVPGLPLQGAPIGSWLIAVMAVISLVWGVLDNRQERPNQAVASRVNWGYALFVLGMFIPGWPAFVVGTTGVWLSRRPRKGAIMKPWPVLVAVAFALYIWFDIIAPNAAPVLNWLAGIAPWLPMALTAVLSADVLRPMVFVVYIFIFGMTMLRSSEDQTSMIILGFSLLIGWYTVFGVFPYAEAWSVQYGQWLFWGLMVLLTIGLLAELAETGTISAAVITAVIAGLVWMSSWAIDQLVPQASVGPLRYFTGPFTLMMSLALLFSWWLYRTLSSTDKRSQSLGQIVASWAGAVLFIKSIGFAILIDVFLLLFLAWTAAIARGVAPF
jgi:hypothetical protein